VNIGARKSGTTSVFDWLAAHPDVCASSPKGTEFLLEQESPYARPESNYHSDGLEGYEHYYRHWAGEPVILEGTTRYFEAESPCAVLAQLDPQPHIFAVLREPTNRAYSAFRYMQKNQCRIDQKITFPHFLECVKNGRIDALLSPEERMFPPEMQAKHQAEMATTLSCGKYVDHLRRWRDAFEPGRLHLYLFEDLKNNPRAFMTRLARDINLDAGYYGDFPFKASNQTAGVRSPAVERFARRLKPFFPKRQITRTLKKWYRNLQAVPVEPRHKPDEAALNSLREFYRSFNERLAEEFSLDLSAWNGN
jgi:hypothetical protein